MTGQTGVSSFEIILVDDGSTDESPAVLRDLAAADRRIRVERLDQRRGPAAARNLGLQVAAGDVVAFTDDDCLPEPTWLAALVAGHDDGFDIVQGRTESGTPRAQRGTYSNVVEIRAFSHLYQTCNVSYRRDLLARLGGFDETFGFSAGGAPNGEDADLGWRATEGGARATFVPEAVVFHPVTPRSFAQAWLARLRALRMVYFVHRHPGFRRYAVGRMFFQRSHPYAVLGLGGLAQFLVLRSWWSAAVACLALVPYAAYRWWTDPLVGRRRFQPLLIAGAWLIDCSEVLVMLMGSIRWRTLFL